MNVSMERTPLLERVSAPAERNGVANATANADVDEVPPARRIRLVDLKDNGCRWPFGDPRDRDFGFCGRRRIDGAPYCAPHAALAFRERGAIS
jgi:GcrA cell cycle regulator